jgi:hypothetical protein
MGEVNLRSIVSTSVSITMYPLQLLHANNKTILQKSVNFIIICFAWLFIFVLCFSIKMLIKQKQVD